MDGTEAATSLRVPAHATRDDIQRAFRRAALRAHPDLGGDEDSFRLLVEARDRLLHLACTSPAGNATGSAVGGADEGTVRAPVPTRNRFTDAFTPRRATKWSQLDRPRRAATTRAPGGPWGTTSFERVLAAAMASAPRITAA